MIAPPPHLFRSAIRLDPSYSLAHCGLGNVLARQGRDDGAIIEYREAIRLDPDSSVTHLNLGISLHRKGDVAGALAAGREAVRLAPKSTMAHNSLGIYLAKAGHVAEAVEALRESIRLEPWNWKAFVNLALALQQGGRFSDAAEAMRRADELAAGRKGLPDLSGEVTRCELYAGLESRLPAILAGEDRPTDNVERLGLALVCLRTKRYALAARFYAEAFAGDPTLARDFEHRYYAVCSAACAGSVSGLDTDTLNHEARRKWRQQALDWLRKDLAWKRETASAADLMIMLTYWLRDPDLSGVRDESELAKLPEAEQKEWREFWAEVRSAVEEAGSDK